MPSENFIYALTLTLIAGLSTGLGGIIILFSKRFSPKFLSAALGFSAGVMILISFVELFSEANESLSGLYGEKLGMLYTLLSFFGGMALIAIIDNLVPSYENPHEVNTLTLEVNKEAVEEESLLYPDSRTLRRKEKNPGIGETNNNHTAGNPTDKNPVAKDHPATNHPGANHPGDQKLMRLGILSTIVIAVHNFPEGMATFVSALEDPALGISIAFAIAIHNIPEGIAIAIPIYYATRKKSKAVLNATLSGLAEPLGGVLGYFLLSGLLTHSFLGIILAGVAGIMVYISLDELLPTAESYGAHHTALLGVLAGMAFMGFGLLLF